MLEAPEDLLFFIKENCPGNLMKFPGGIDTCKTLLTHSPDPVKQLTYHLAGQLAMKKDFKTIYLLFNDHLLSSGRGSVENIANLTRRCIRLGFAPELIEAVNHCIPWVKIEAAAILKREGPKMKKAPPPKPTNPPHSTHAAAPPLPAPPQKKSQGGKAARKKK